MNTSAHEFPTIHSIPDVDEVSLKLWQSRFKRSDQTYSDIKVSIEALYHKIILKDVVDPAASF